MILRGGSVIGWCVGALSAALLSASIAMAAPDPADDVAVSGEALTSLAPRLSPTAEPPPSRTVTPTGYKRDEFAPEGEPSLETLTSTLVLTPMAARILEALETTAPVAPDNAGESVSVAVRRFYAARQYEPVWVNTLGPLPRASSLVGAVLDAAKDGLEPADYITPGIQALFLAKDAAGMAKLEAALTWAFVRLTSDLASGRTVPGEVDPELFVHPHDIDPAHILARAANVSDVRAVVMNLAPQTDAYRNLKAALERYRAIERLGGWTSMSQGRILRPGMRGPRVAELRQVLAERGEAVDPDSDHYDQALIDTVRDFQRRHGLTPDGAFGPSSRRALNMPVGKRIAQLVINMERLRWMPDDLGQRYAFVNLADFRLEVVFDNEVVYESRVVVGSNIDRTPVFSDRMTYLVVNPYWNIPPSIAGKEMLPKLREDPYALEKKGIRVFANWGATAPEIDPGEIDWHNVSSTRFPYKLRQDPSRRNALGRIKFMFPNKFNIYLHDTPSKAHFRRTVRNFSHGCIRVEEPFRLAKLLLGGNGRWTDERFDGALASMKRRSISLNQPVNVHLTYLTAWVDRSGVVQFRTDVYKRDRRLTTALDASRRRIPQAVASSG